MFSAWVTSSRSKGTGVLILAHQIHEFAFQIFAMKSGDYLGTYYLNDFIPESIKACLIEIRKTNRLRYITCAAISQFDLRAMPDMNLDRIQKIIQGRIS